MHVSPGTGGADKDCPQNRWVTHKHYLHVDATSVFPNCGYENQVVVVHTFNSSTWEPEAGGRL